MVIDIQSMLKEEKARKQKEYETEAEPTRFARAPPPPPGSAMMMDMLAPPMMAMAMAPM
jgi:hypothetical protein